MKLGRELSVAALLGTVWALDRLFQRSLQCSPIIGQLLAGIILGPALLDAVVFAEAFRLLGKLGIMLLVTRGAMDVDIAAVQRLGPRAFAAAATGVLAPVLLAIAFMVLVFEESARVGLAVGAAIAPTSLGFSAKLLAEVGKLESEEGMLICVAAVVDDVMALVLLTEIQALSASNPSAWDIAAPLVGSLSSILLGIFLAPFLSRRLPTLFLHLKDRSHRLQVKLACLICLSLLFGFLCATVHSSDLLGCFFAGLVFSGDDELAQFWSTQVKRFEQWGAALFFAATIGFGVPRLAQKGGLFDAPSFLRGLLMTVAAVLGKLALGVWAEPRGWVSGLTFGAAMMGRGEFSFLIADSAADDGLLSDTNYSGVIWALLFASFGAPFGFRYMLSKAPPSATPANASTKAESHATEKANPSSSLAFGDHQL